MDDSSSSANASITAAIAIAEQQQHSLPPVPPPPAFVPPTRISLQTQQQRISAFEVYRKPQTPAPVATGGAAAVSTVASQLPSAENFEKRVTAISDSLRHVSFKQNQTSTTELLQRLREQNNSLLHLCNDLSDELLSVQTRKEEMRLKLENFTGAGAAPALDAAAMRADSSISAPVTANTTGGSSASGGAHTNV